MFMKLAKFLLFMLVLTWLLVEITLRVFSSRTDHVVTLFNKRWYYLAPFDMPQRFPDVSKPSDPYRVYDSDLGWSLGKNAVGAPLYYSDANGYRCSKTTYDLMREVKQPSYLEYDVVCIGDSFTHGDEVHYEETWPYYLSKSSNLNILNLGVGGYGIDQAGLRYLKEKPKTKMVILGLISGDLERACTQVYDLIGGGLKTKPIFIFIGDSVCIKNSPAIFGEDLEYQFQYPEQSDFLSLEPGYPQLFVHHWYDRSYLIRVIKTFPLWSQSKQSIYRSNDERLDYCIKILNYFNQETQKQGAEFRVLILDNMNTFKDWTKYSDPWLLFRSKLEENDIKYFSNGNELAQLYFASRDSIINRGLVHYTPHANKLIAKFLLQQNEIENLMKEK
jgi:hypothetical protein